MALLGYSWEHAYLSVSKLLSAFLMYSNSMCMSSLLEYYMYMMYVHGGWLDCGGASLLGLAPLE